MPATAYSLPLQVLPGIAADKLGLFLPLAPQTDEQIAYFEEAARSKARYEAECARVAAENTEHLWEWLGTREAAVASEEPSRLSYYEMTVVIVGKTAQAVEALKAAYLARHADPIYSASFQPIEPWHKGFRVTGSRGMR